MDKSTTITHFPVVDVLLILYGCYLGFSQKKFGWYTDPHSCKILATSLDLQKKKRLEHLCSQKRTPRVIEVILKEKTMVTIVNQWNFAYLANNYILKMMLGIYVWVEVSHGEWVKMLEN